MQFYQDGPWVVRGVDAWGPPPASLKKGRPNERPHVRSPVGPRPQAGLGVQRDLAKKRKMDPSDVTFMESIMPLFRLMQALTVLPVQVAKDGKVRFKWLSPMVVYSVVVFGALSVPVVYVGRVSFQRLLQSDGMTFSDQIYAMTPILLLHTHALIPLLYWREGRGVAFYYNGWSSYEAMYRKVCRQPVRLNLRGTVFKYTLAMLGVSVLYTTTMPLYMATTLWQSLAYLHLSVISFSIVCLWSLNALAAERAADRLRDALHLEVTSGSCSAETISEFRQLWLLLSDLTQESGTAWTYSYGHMLLYEFLLMTVTSFGVLAGVTQHSLDARTLAYGALASLSGLVLFVICSAAENAADKVSTVLREDLLAAQLSGEDQHFKNEVQMFMTALAMNPPSVNLSGYATVNRALFASLLETMVTYLVVLVQFAYSLDTPAGTRTVDDASTTETTDLSTTPSSA